MNPFEAHPIRIQQASLPSRARTLAGLLCLLMILLGASMAGAQSFSKDIPQFDVFAGFDGVIPESDWFPVTCEVRNEGPTFLGTFEFHDNAMGGGLLRELQIELPTGTLKRFSFPMFTTTRYGSQYSATLRDEKGRVIAQTGTLQPRFHISWQSFLMAAIPSSAAGIPTFPGDPSRSYSARPVAATARLQPEAVPDNPISLEGMDALYLNSQRAVDLKEPQTEALMSWLHDGGHLIVGVDAVVDVNGVPWLKGLLPGSLGSVRTVEIGKHLDEWLRAMPDAPVNGGPVNPNQIYRNLRAETPFDEASIRTIALTPVNADVELAIDGTPLIVSQRQGRGRVTFLLFNPEQEPLRSWKLRPFFWARLNEIPGYLLQDQSVPNQGYTGVDGVVGAMVDSKQVRKLPVSALLGLLVVYLLVIGPFDQWWLKRINRQMLTWITFPCYVVLFSVLIYVIGYKLRAGESEWNEMQFVDVIPKGSQAELHGTTYGSLYSPVNARYELAGDQKYAALRGEYLGAAANRSIDGRAILKADQYEAVVDVPVWTSQVFIGQWVDDGPMPYTASIKRKDGSNDFELAITNRELPAGAPFRVALGDRIYEFKLPAKGATATFALPQGGGVRIADFVNSGSREFYAAANQRNQGFGSDTARFSLRPPDATMAISLAGAMEINQNNNNYNYYGGRFLTPGHLEISDLLRQDFAVVMVWCENYAPVKPMNRFHPRRSSRSALMRLAVPLNSPEK